MKRQLLLCAILTLSSTVLYASPCLPGSLQSYLNLGTAGCNVGAVQFSDFSVESGLTGATPIAPALISVTPGTAAGAASLLFTLNRQSAATQVLESFIRFSESATGLAETSPALNAPTASGDGVVTGVLNVCSGTYSGTLTGCSGVERTAVVFSTGDDTLLADTVRFAPSSFFDVFLDLTIDGGLAGTAALPSAVVTAAVPEPSTYSLLLVGGALFAAALRTRRAF